MLKKSVVFGYKSIYVPTPNKNPQFLHRRPNFIRAMEESFRVRIDKVFGSLASSSASSASVSSLWCLAEDEIDSNERSGEKEVSEPSSSFPDIRTQENEPTSFSIDGEEGQSSGLHKPNDYNDEEWEIKNSIGIDSTLDMEEEEDDNDKVALGEKVYGYIKDVNDYDTEADEWVELPASFKEREKDPRANLIAAKLRLKEDAEAVNKLNSLHVSEVPQDNLSMSTSGNEKALVVSEDNLLGTCKETHVGSSDNSGLKPILKRKENQADDSKLQKRVRFSSNIKDDNSTEGDKDSVMDTSSPNEHKVEADYPTGDYPTGIPDYMRNPSKYTRYTFDSGEVDEESNRKAYMDFLNMIRSRDEPLVEPLVELPRSVAFVPKRKPMAESKVDNIDMSCEGRKVSIAVDTIEDCTVSAMEEDEPETALNVKRRPSRQYRARAKEDPEEG